MSNLYCTDCSELPQYNLGTLQPECMKCCQSDKSQNPDTKVRNRVRGRQTLGRGPSGAPMRIIVGPSYARKKWSGPPIVWRAN
jgi:hypothetical protein